MLRKSERIAAIRAPSGFELAAGASDVFKGGSMETTPDFRAIARVADASDVLETGSDRRERAHSIVGPQV